MKTTGTITTVLLGMASLTSAHYAFDKTELNGKQVGGDNASIRKHQNGFMPIKFNKTPEGSITPTVADFACNKGAVGAKDVLKVKAGDKVAMRQGFGANGMLHPGPAQVYVSPVANAKTDNGEDWYKIHQSLICKQGSAESLRTDAWCSWGENNVNAIIPATIPDGQYLLRGEHIGLHGAHDGQAEFYVACMQIEVTGNSATSMPGTSAKIPGIYKSTDKAVNFSVWGSSTSYDVSPGPDVIPGGTIRGSANGAGGDKTTTVSGGGASAAASNGNNNNNNNNKNTSGTKSIKQVKSNAQEDSAECNGRRRRSLPRRAAEQLVDEELQFE
ncbi:hypothetical protein PpBr36_02546 [Pyricularia pennisetigena]|uniref:hypothetical protein n=1 Tax=Pyricularia pennisetigena TaxID=1578925 RepID=UPI00114EDD18|nr:hypothetical protein PpBr36_02546 [Pyricularia pennisetigena]TLS30775.1 hypothetical protein PpBr36_02546 [Pyricularia pennisetigena]